MLGTIDTQREPRMDASRWAAATLAVVLVGVVVLITWITSGRPSPGADVPLPWLESLVAIVSYGVAGAVLIDRRPDLPFGWLLSGTAVLVVVQVVALLPAYDAAVHGDRGGLVGFALTTASFTFLPIAVQGLINVRFPSGRPATRFGRVLEIALIAGTALVVLGGFLGSSSPSELTGDPSFTNPLTGGTPIGRVADTFIFLAPVVVLLGLVAGLGVVVRFARAHGIERQQLKWRAVGVLVALALFPLAVTDHLGALNAVDSLLFVLTLAVPVLRYRLWAIDTILRRSVVYALITALLAAGYIGVSAVIGQFASDRLAGPVAAAAVALLFAPLRGWVQGLVDRFFYGDRSDPYRTLRELSRQLNAVRHGDVLGSLVASVATSLRLPYVAIERPDGVILAASGVEGPKQERWPLAYEQRVEGFLLASPRRGEDVFDERDAALLGDVAGQIGVAVHAESLTTELLRSRERLVSTREEERRRLRRDLHDGIGPGAHRGRPQPRRGTRPARHRPGERRALCPRREGRHDPGAGRTPAARARPAAARPGRSRAGRRAAVAVRTAPRRIGTARSSSRRTICRSCPRPSRWRCSGPRWKR